MRVRRQRRGDDGDRAALDGLVDELGAVGTQAGQREEQEAGLDGA